jgi:AcrR family transcriptional regulator
MGRKPIKEQRCKEILNALYKCLLRKPFSETSMKDIGEEVRMNSSLLHYYFKNKEDILLHFIDSISERYREDFNIYARDLRERGLNHQEFLQESFNFMNTIAGDKKTQFIWLGIWQIALFNPKVKARIQKNYRDWIQMLEKHIRSGGSNPVFALRMAMMIMAFQEGMSMLLVCFDLKKKDYNPIFKTFQEKIIEMVYAPGVHIRDTEGYISEKIKSAQL